MTASGAPAFQGLRVLDFSRVIAGPACTQNLADFGAEVIKIENPRGGDDGRATAGPRHGGESHFHLAFNRGKKSVALDTTTPEGLELALQMADQADVVIENFKPGTMEKWGLGYQALSKGNPGLIMLSTSLMGQSGPWAALAGFGVAIWKIVGTLRARPDDKD